MSWDVYFLLQLKNKTKHKRLLVLQLALLCIGTDGSTMLISILQSNQTGAMLPSSMFLLRLVHPLISLSLSLPVKILDPFECY